MTPVIRKYDPHDLGELLSVWYDAAKLAHPFSTAEKLDQERRDISEKFLPMAETWVFEDEQQVVGFIALLGNEVGGIFVSPTRHGHGIGRALMDHARAGRDHLELEVFEDNEIGRAFYDAYGFHRVGERRDDETGLRVLRLRLDCP